MKSFGRLALFSVALMLFPALAHADQLVFNGNFAADDAGWTYNNQQWYIGSSTASTGCVGADCITGSGADQAYLYQDLATTAGNTYTLTFEYGPGYGTPNELKTLFGGTAVSDLVNLQTGYNYATYTVSGLVATSSVTRLEFLGRQDPSGDELTGISVTTAGIGAPNVTPEPESLVLLGTGVLGILGVARRGRRAIAPGLLPRLAGIFRA